MSLKFAIPSSFNTINACYLLLLVPYCIYRYKKHQIIYHRSKTKLIPLCVVYVWSTNNRYQHSIISFPYQNGQYCYRHVQHPYHCFPHHRRHPRTYRRRHHHHLRSPKECPRLRARTRMIYHYLQQH